MAEVPNVVAVRAWSMITSASLTDDQVQQVLDAEKALQEASCAFQGDEYPSALAQALLRRCAREMGARQLPLGLTADTSGEYAPSRLPSFDVEIERLEAPYRVVAVA